MDLLLGKVRVARSPNFPTDNLQISDRGESEDHGIQGCSLSQFCPQIPQSGALPAPRFVCLEEHCPTRIKFSDKLKFTGGGIAACHYATATSLWAKRFCPVRQRNYSWSYLGGTSPNHGHPQNVLSAGKGSLPSFRSFHGPALLHYFFTFNKHGNYSHVKTSTRVCRTVSTCLFYC